MWTYDTITYQYYLKLINVSLIIYLLICNSLHTPLARHPVQSELEQKKKKKKKKHTKYE